MIRAIPEWSAEGPVLGMRPFNGRQYMLLGVFTITMILTGGVQQDAKLVVNGVVLFITAIEMSKTRGLWVEQLPPGPLFSALTVCALIAGASWVNPEAGVHTVITIFTLGCLTYLTRQLSADQIPAIYTGLYMVMTAFSVASQVALSLQVLPTWLEMGRLAGPLGYANTYAILVAATYWIGWRVRYRPVRNREAYRHVFLCAQSIHVATLIATSSRGAWAAFALGGVVFFLAGARRWRSGMWASLASGALLAVAQQNWGLAWFILSVGVILALSILGAPELRHAGYAFGAGALVLLLAFVLSPSVAAAARPYFSAHTLRDRLAYWDVALHLMKLHPFGIGGGGWADLYPRYQRFAFFTTEVHNTYLQSALEAGLQGSLLLAVAGTTACVRLGRRMSAWPIFRVREAPVAAAVAALVVHAAFDLDGSFLVFWQFVILLMVGLRFRSPRRLPAFSRPAFGRIAALTGLGLVLLVTTALGVSRLLQVAADRISQTDPLRAERLLVTGLRLNPLAASLHLDLAALQVTKKPASVASGQVNSLLSTAAALRPYSPEVAERIGQVNLFAGQPDLAWGWFVEAVDRAPYRGPAYVLAFQTAYANASAGPPELRSVWQQRCLDLGATMVERARSQPTWVSYREAMQVDAFPVRTALDLCATVGGTK